jgi:hypothetical protein
LPAVGVLAEKDTGKPSLAGGEEKKNIIAAARRRNEKYISFILAGEKARQSSVVSRGWTARVGWG